jgi:hypothetical protein
MRIKPVIGVEPLGWNQSEWKALPGSRSSWDKGDCLQISLNAKEEILSHSARLLRVSCAFCDVLFLVPAWMHGKGECGDLREALLQNIDWLSHRLPELLPKLQSWHRKPQKVTWILGSR